MQPSVDKIVKLCLDAGLPFKKNIHGRNCGFHPSNRAGTGVDPFNAQDLALKISEQAYSETKLKNPIGFEKPASTQVFWFLSFDTERFDSTVAIWAQTNVTIVFF